jgi:Protein of unknown function (DUF3383)
MIPVSRVVRVAISSSPTFPSRKGFGLLCIVGSSTALPAGDRVRFYADMDGIGADFPASTEEYKAAAICFSQSPAPVQLAIARRFAAPVAGQLFGSVTVSRTIADYTAVTAGALDIKIDGTVKNITGLSFVAATNLNAVAAALQVKLTAAAAGTTCVWSGSRFVVTSGTTGVASTVDFATPGVSGDVSALLGLRAADLGYTFAGAGAESVTQSLDAIQNLDQSWYGFVLTAEATDAQCKEAMAWAEPRIKLYGCTTNASNVLDATSTTDIAAYANAAGYEHTFMVWSNSSFYAAASALVRAFAVNFNEQGSAITLKFKQLPGIAPSTIGESARLTLDAKKCNYYSNFGSSPMLAEGWMASGKFFDQVHGLHWLQNAIETNVFGYLYTRVTKVQQTDKGVATIVQQVERACQQAVNNGLLAPGNWGGSDLGTIKAGDFLPRGFYVYAQPVASQNLSDRALRKAPPIQVIAKGGGAIHFADISVTFES